MLAQDLVISLHMYTEQFKTIEKSRLLLLVSSLGDVQRPEETSESASALVQEVVEARESDCSCYRAIMRLYGLDAVSYPLVFCAAFR